MNEEIPVKSLQRGHTKEAFADALLLFQSLADNAPALIWMTGSDQLYNFFNKRWLHFTGNSLEQEIGSGWMNGIHPDDRDEYINVYSDSFKLRKEFAIKYRLRRNDGEYRWLLNSGCAFHLPNGEFAGYIGSSVDMTESVSEIKQLEEQNYITRTIADNATVGLFLLGKDLLCNFTNQAAENITGYSSEEILGKNLHQILHHTRPDGTSHLSEDCDLEQVVEKQKAIKDLEEIFIHKNGHFFNAVCSTSPIYKDGEFTGAVIEIRDITEQRRVEQEVKRNEDRFKALIENSSDVVALIDAHGKTLYSSPSVERVLGYTHREYAASNDFGFVHPADLNYVMEEFVSLLEEPGGSRLTEVRVKHKDDTWRWIENVSTNLIHDPNIQAIVVNFRDITERKMAEEQASYQYYHDSLTDLPNRNYFTKKIGEYLQGGKEKMFGVMIIDLDRFKMINESLGHAIGDRLIQEVSLRFANCLEDHVVLARLGGDEYGIVLPNIQREEEVGQACLSILESLKPAFKLEQHELYITPSIGISVFPYDGNDTSSLMKNADSALYRAKELGRNNFQYYNPSMNATTFQQLAMENTLRKALENDEFIVYYQPQIDVVTGKIVEVEALVRWMHPELGLTFPDEFIPIAETTGLIQPIGEWVMQRACEDLRKWNDMGHHLHLAVNMSVRQLRQRHLVKNIRHIIHKTGIDSQCLELELTESVLVENSHSVYNTLVELKKDGIKFAIDDFNTGYSSLNYIKRYPIDILKIDKSFVRGIPSKEKDMAIANSVINLSHSLGMIVVAEGVERDDQLKFLSDRGCDKAQGYLISPPVPFEEMTNLIQSGKIWKQ